MTTQITTNDDPKIGIFYERVFTDDTGKHIPELFSKNNFDTISIKTYWGNTVDAFFKYNCLFMFTAVEGDFRIVTAYENDNTYKFNQFFISGLDGKVIKVPKNILFGINNLNSTPGSIVIAKIGNDLEFDNIKPSIFNWHSKH